MYAAVSLTTLNNVKSKLEVNESSSSSAQTSSVLQNATYPFAYAFAFFHLSTDLVLMLGKIM